MLADPDANATAAIANTPSALRDTAPTSGVVGRRASIARLGVLTYPF
jgi:hypothetical protein